MAINIIIKSRTKRLNKSKIKRLIKFLGKSLSINRISLSIVFCGEKFIRKLNKKYRNIDKSTDILSFESGEEKYIGDMIISIPNVWKNVIREKLPFEEEILRLIIHGFLHLLGYEHKEKDSAMIKLQEELLKNFLREENA